MEMIATRREIIVRGFFWALLVSVSLLTLYFLLTGGPDKRQAVQPKPADVQQQISLLQAALKEKPNDLRTLVSLGDSYLNASNIREAYRIFLRAEKVAPKDSHVLNDLGSIYQQIGRYDQALNSYQRAYQSDPGHGSSLLNMALIYSRNKGDNDKALVLLQKFLAGNPEPQSVATAQQEIARIKQALQGGRPSGDAPN